MIRDFARLWCRLSIAVLQAVLEVLEPPALADEPFGEPLGDCFWCGSDPLLCHCSDEPAFEGFRMRADDETGAPR